MKYDEMVKYYEEKLKQKDKIIKKLKQDNLLLLKTALKQSKKSSILAEHTDSLLRINKKLRDKNQNI